jgi:hypothetical protein
LESKLVLITGSKAEYRTEVDHYLNVSSHSRSTALYHLFIFSLDSPTCDQNC